MCFLLCKLPIKKISDAPESEDAVERFVFWEDNIEVSTLTLATVKLMNWRQPHSSHPTSNELLNVV